MIGSNGGSIGGTDDWYSPELLEILKSGENETRRDGTVKSDVFSQGLVFGCYILQGQNNPIQKET
jgi:serine/threonine-protein kinase/endoribonuclease IRE1